MQKKDEARQRPVRTVNPPHPVQARNLVIRMVPTMTLAPKACAEILTREQIRALVFAQYGEALRTVGVPIPFSQDFLGLPLNDPRRDAALIRAALAWWTGVPNDDVVDREITRRMAWASHEIAQLWPEANARHRAHQAHLRAQRSMG